MKRSGRAALDTALESGEQVVHLGASVGIARYPEHGLDAGTLLRHADVAMYAAKQSRSGHAVYDPARDHNSPERQALVRALREAIASGGLTLHYQPQVEVAGGLIRGVEALARWPHPVRGPVAPDRFIPLAEQTGLIRPLTAWVLEAAVRQCASWQREGLRLAVSVNLSVCDGICTIRRCPSGSPCCCANTRRHRCTRRWS